MKYAKRIENAGADSICIKDMAALLTPYETYDLVKALKEAVKIPIQIAYPLYIRLGLHVHAEGH